MAQFGASLKPVLSTVRSAAMQRTAQVSQTMGPGFAGEAPQIQFTSLTGPKSDGVASESAETTLSTRGCQVCPSKA
jgi:hypothetical protein